MVPRKPSINCWKKGNCRTRRGNGRICSSKLEGGTRNEARTIILVNGLGQLGGAGFEGVPLTKASSGLVVLGVFGLEEKILQFQRRVGLFQRSTVDACLTRNHRR